MLVRCGTMAGSSQIISIDSEPRGIAVYHMDGDERKALGKTPVFARIDRERTQLFRFGSANPIDVSETCGIRWAESAIPDGIMLGFGFASQAAWLAFAAGFIGIDLYTGNFYECDDTIVAKLSATTPAPIEKPLKFLIIPPAHRDPLVADTTAAKWIELAQKKIGHRSKFFSGDKVREYLDFYNLDSSRDLTIDSFMQSQLRELGFISQATHIVFFTEKSSDSTIIVEPKIYDLHRLTEDRSFGELSLAITDAQRVAGFHSVNWFSRTISFFPNSVTLSSDSNVTGQGLDAQGGYELKDVSEARGIPRYISAFGIDSVAHPKGYKTWDTTWTVFPALFGSFNDLTLTFEPAANTEARSSSSPTPAPFDYRIRYLYLLPSVNTGPQFFTPIGTFGIYAAAGPLLLFMKDSIGNEWQRGTLAIGVKFEWYAFLSERFYIQLYAGYYGMNDPILDTQFFTSTNIVNSGVGIGYYFPAIKSKARKLLGPGEVY